MTTLFNIQHPTSSSDRAVCTSDPCLLSIPEERKDLGDIVSRRHSDPLKTRISALALRVVPFGSYNGGPPSGLGQLYIENGATFFQLSIISNDLSLSECLYIGPVPGVDLEITPPDTRIRKEIVKTAAKVSRAFLVPDRVGDQDSDDSFEEISPQLPNKGASSATLGFASKDPWTVSFERLEEELHEVSSSDGLAFDEILKHLHDAIDNKYRGDCPHMETLYVGTNLWIISHTDSALVGLA